MKKILSTLGALLLSATACALPIGNPWEASIHTNGVLLNCPCEPASFWNAWSVRMGYYGDFVFNRQMRKVNSTYMTRTTINTNAGYLALNFCDRIDLFSTIGATSIAFKGHANAWAVSDRVRDGSVVCPTHLSWSLGLRTAIWEYCNWALGAEAQYFRSKPCLGTWERAGANAFYFDNNERLTYEEWQAGLAVTYRIELIPCSLSALPYIGAKWACADMHTGNPRRSNGNILFTVPNLENARDFGYAVGLTLLGCNKSSLTLEGRFNDETAFYVNGQFRF